MRLVSFNGGRSGILTDRGVVDVTELTGVPNGFWPPVAMVKLIRDFDSLQEKLRRLEIDGDAVPESSVQLEAPVQWPNKIIAFPANYHAHIDEMKATSGLISRTNASGQGFFLKANSSLSGPNDPIVLPNISDREVHHECELGIIIGKRGRAISPNDSNQFIFGFTCLLDMVVRGKEERVMRKSFDTFCPIGPWIVTADEVPSLESIALSLKVNGKVRQTASTRDLIVDIPAMISMASAVTTLEAGDIIASGTPAGVGPIAVGDTLEISISDVGAMVLKVVAGTHGDHPVWHAAATA